MAASDWDGFLGPKRTGSKTTLHGGTTACSCASTNAGAFGIATCLHMLAKVSDKRPHQIVPEFGDFFLGCLAGNAMVGKVFPFHCIDANLSATPLEETIEMLQCFPSSISGRSQQTITGISTKDRGVIFIVRHGELLGVCPCLKSRFGQEEK